MEVTNETGHRALLYVAAVQRHGVLLTVDGLEAYVAKPTRRRPTIRRRRGVPKAGLSALMMHQQMRRSVQAILENVYTTLPEGKGTGGESVTDWLVRLGWLSVEDDHVRITAPGRAVLNHLEEARIDLDVPMAVVLDPQDELALARVIGELSTLGRCALVDPYFSIEHLLTILQSTEIDRVLIGTGDHKKLTELAVGLSSVSSPRRFDLRKSNAIHDRLALPEDGAVRVIGTSLTGVGNRLSMMVTLDEGSAAGEAVRARFEEVWRNAEVVGRLEPRADEALDEPAEPSDVDAADELVEPADTPDDLEVSGGDEGTEPTSDDDTAESSEGRP